MEMFKGKEALLGALERDAARTWNKALFPLSPRRRPAPSRTASPPPSPTAARDATTLGICLHPRSQQKMM